MRIGAQDVIWITGAKGRIGSAILRVADHSRYSFLATDAEIDITDYAAVTQFTATNRPNVIINCAGAGSLAFCEENSLEAFKVNALGARNVAAAAQSVGARIVQISTDDVFSGKRSVLYDEFDKPHPRHIYGKSKLAGEEFVRELNPRHIIVRSCWVYANTPGHIFARILEAGRTGHPIGIPANQFSSPTSAMALGRCIMALINADEFGVFHAADSQVCSRYEFAQEILRLMDLPLDSVTPTYDPDDAYRLTLSDMMLKMTGVYEMPEWRADLKEFIDTMVKM